MRRNGRCLTRPRRSCGAAVVRAEEGIADGRKERAARMPAATDPLAPHLATFWHRDERAMRKPYWRLRERQRFQDGARVAELLVAVRQSLNEQECAGPGEDRRQAIKARHPKRALHITAAIAGGNAAIEAVGDPKTPAAPEGGDKRWKPGANAEKTRWLPWQRRTPSWQAAYNAACLYAVLADSDRYRQNEKELMDWAVVSLKRVVDDRHCEMERPWDWISRDPDLRCLNKSPVFRELLRKQKQNDYPRANPGPDHTGTELAAAARGLTCRAATQVCRQSHAGPGLAGVGGVSGRA